MVGSLRLRVVTRGKIIPNMHDSIALSVIMMPRDSNIYGTIFGGIILSYIDQAGFVEARRHGVHRWVTASVDRVDFKKTCLCRRCRPLYNRHQQNGKLIRCGRR